MQRLHERSKERRARKIEAGFGRSRRNIIVYEKERYGKRVERIGKWRKREEPKRENKSWPPPERAEGGGKGRWRKREEMEERQERRRRIWESKRAA